MWIEAKQIKKRLYLYLRWREGEHTRSRYLGRAPRGWQVGMTKQVNIDPRTPKEQLPVWVLRPPAEGGMKR